MRHSCPKLNDGPREFRLKVPILSMSTRIHVRVMCEDYGELGSRVTIACNV